MSPSLPPAPLQMSVRQAIIVGRSCFVAQRRAAAILPWSWPSTAFTAQPAALKRAIWSPVSEMVAAPSMVVLLSSNSTVSLLSLKRPAIEMASWLTPSIRQPSPAITQVRWSTRSSPKRAFR